MADRDEGRDQYLGSDRLPSDADPSEFWLRGGLLCERLGRAEKPARPGATVARLLGDAKAIEEGVAADDGELDPDDVARRLARAAIKRKTAKAIRKASGIRDVDGSGFAPADECLTMAQVSPICTFPILSMVFDAEPDEDGGRPSCLVVASRELVAIGSGVSRLGGELDEVFGRTLAHARDEHGFDPAGVVVELRLTRPAEEYEPDEVVAERLRFAWPEEHGASPKVQAWPMTRAEVERAIGGSLPEAMTNRSERRGRSPGACKDD